VERRAPDEASRSTEGGEQATPNAKRQTPKLAAQTAPRNPFQDLNEGSQA
jgi:hypothetical protein